MPLTYCWREPPFHHRLLFLSAPHTCRARNAVMAEEAARSASTIDRLTVTTSDLTAEVERLR